MKEAMEAMEAIQETAPAGGGEESRADEMDERAMMRDLLQQMHALTMVQVAQAQKDGLNVSFEKQRLSGRKVVRLQHLDVEVVNTSHMGAAAQVSNGVSDEDLRHPEAHTSLSDSPSRAGFAMAGRPSIRRAPS
jgi:hypothetical protein